MVDLKNLNLSKVLDLMIFRKQDKYNQLFDSQSREQALERFMKVEQQLSLLTGSNTTIIDAGYRLRKCRKPN